MNRKLYGVKPKTSMNRTVRPYRAQTGSHMWIWLPSINSIPRHRSFVSTELDLQPIWLVPAHPISPRTIYFILVVFKKWKRKGQEMDPSGVFFLKSKRKQTATWVLWLRYLANQMRFVLFYFFGHTTTYFMCLTDPQTVWVVSLKRKKNKIKSAEYLWSDKLLLNDFCLGKK